MTAPEITPPRVVLWPNGSERVRDLKRRLSNARKRALFWSGNPSFTGGRFSVRKNRNGWEGYELAMCDIRNLCDTIERVTGKRPKESDPKREFGNRFQGLMNAITLSLQNDASQQRAD